MSNEKRIRLGIVGTGTIAHRFAEAIKNVPEAELVAVASRARETLYITKQMDEIRKMTGVVYTQD